MDPFNPGEGAPPAWSEDSVDDPFLAHRSTLADQLDDLSLEHPFTSSSGLPPPALEGLQLGGSIAAAHAASSNGGPGTAVAMEASSSQAALSPGDDADEDPLAALEAAIEEDRPRSEPSAEWQRMMVSMEQDAAGTGPVMLPQETSAAAARENGASQAAVTQPATSPAAVLSAAMDEEDSESTSCSVILPPLQQGDSLGDDEGREEDSAAEPSNAAATTAAPAGSEQPSNALEHEEGEEASMQSALRTSGTPPNSDAERARAFGALQPICSQLLPARADAARLTQLLHRLAALLQALSQPGLQGCFDYVVFPLQLALESAAATRQGADQQGGPPPAMPGVAADTAAEATTHCLLLLLQRAHCERGEQLLGLLQRLSALLILPPGPVSEELQLTCLRCVGAAMQGALSSPPEVLEGLREEDSAPAVGHLTSLLLQAAAAQLHAGPTGSKAVRKEALRALRVSLEAVGTADALSFFLPGLATGLGRALMAATSSGGAQAGPAASAAAAEEALGALTTLLCITLGDESSAAVLEERQQDAADQEWAQTEGTQAEEEPGEGAALSAAMRQLQALAEKGTGRGTGEEAAGDGVKSPSSSSTAEPAAMPHALAPLKGEQPRLRVERTPQWLHGAAGRVHDLLAAILPPLIAYHKPAVREALARACIRLLTDCSLALAPSSPLLLETLFALAQDDWPLVRQLSRDWLTSELGQQGVSSAIGSVVTDSTSISIAEATFGSVSAGSRGSAGRQLLTTAEASLLQLAEGLPAALRTGDAAGRAHAQKLATCIQVVAPHWLSSHILHHPIRLSSLLSSLTTCLALDSDAAGLLLHATPETGTSYQRSTPAPSDAAAPSGQRGSADSPAREQAAAEKVLAAGAGPGAAAVLLPRMPLGLQFVSTLQTYQAIALVCRSLAATAVAADACAGTSAGGGTALRSLIDACLQRLRSLLDAQQEAPQKKRISRRKQRAEEALVSPAIAQLGDSNEAAAFVQAPWQLQAAQIVIVLTEMLFGASPAWHPLGCAAESGPSQSAAGSSNAELESLVAGAVSQVVNDQIWTLPSSVGLAGSGVDHLGGALPALPPPATAPSAQALGCNVALQRAALECVGACARALGPRFAAAPRVMRLALLPTLEKVGDPSNLVAASAAAAIGSICTHCGYGSGGLRQLVAENADYIVDGLCSQLRQLDTHPRAPQLFAAVLRQSGVAPGLLPLLSEPARQALQGVSILARRKRPEAIFPFVLALREIAHGAGTVAEEAASRLREIASDVQARSEVQVQAWLTAAEAHASGTPSQGQGINGVGEYFRRLQQRRAAHAARQTQEDAPWDEEAEGEAAAKAVALSAAEWDELQLVQRRAAAAAGLAQATADCAGPLALSSSLPVAVQALRACGDALRSLSFATDCLEMHERQVLPLVLPPEGHVSPTDPKPPKLLPSVALLWTPLMAALHDWRVSLVEAALISLAELVDLAGTFLSRRFSQEAWPQLRRLLQEGPSQRRLIAPGQDDASSPAAVQRTQRAVLRCLTSLAAGGGSPAQVLALIASPALGAVAELLGDRQPAPIREAATQAFASLATIDADAAWALLATALRARGPAAPPSFLSVVPPAGTFPPVAALCALPPKECVPSGLAECSAAKLQAMARRVEEMPVRWHSASSLARFLEAA